MSELVLGVFEGEESAARGLRDLRAACPSVEGLGSAGTVIVLPLLGVFIYLIAEGRKMAERSAKPTETSQAQFDDYVNSVAGGGLAAEIE